MIVRIIAIILSVIILVPLQAAENDSERLKQNLFVNITRQIPSRSRTFVDQQGNVSKDPFVLEIGNDDFIVVWGNIAAKSIEAKRYMRTSIDPLQIKPVSEKIRINIEVPNESPHAVRWAPSMAVCRKKLYLYYTKGLVHGSPQPEAENPWGIEWNSFRIYVAEADLNGDLNDLGNKISELNFANERLLMNNTNFSFETPDFSGSPHFGVIDQEIVKQGKKLYCYYVVVTQGIAGVRPHEEFIRVQKMTGYDSTDGIDRPVYDGRAAYFGDCGVAEAPNAFMDNGMWYLVFSSRPSDVDQRIMVITSKDPLFEKHSKPFVILSPAREGFDSIGGQALVRLKNKDKTQHYLLYQGFTKEKEGWPFYLASIDDFLKITQFLSSR